MNEDVQALQRYIPAQEIAAFSPSHVPQLSMEAAALEWVKTKASRSNSEKTKKAYWSTYSQFKAHLEHEGLTLDGDPRAVARIAQD